MWNRRLWRFAAIPMAGVLILTTVAATKTPAAPLCDVAGEWVDLHISELPTEYKEFAKYPAAFRRVILKHSSAEVRAKLIGTHLRKYLDPNEGLNAQQLEFLRYVISKERILSDTLLGRELANSERLAERTRQLFGVDRGRQIFVSFGPEDKVPSRLTVNAASVFGPLNIVTMLVKGLTFGSQLPDCSCNAGDSWCGGSSQCTAGSCRVQGSCGWFGLQNCNGLCYLQS